MAYRISFNANGGSGSMGAITCGRTVTLPKCRYFRSGYKFLGWAADKGSNPVRFKDGQHINDIHRNATFFAKWQLINYKISYHANGGIGTMVAQMCPCGKAMKLNKNKFIRKHYTFAGWSIDKPSDTVKFLDEQVLNDIHRDATFYAVWKPETYYVKFHPGSSNRGLMPSQPFVYSKKAKLYKNNFVKDGGFKFSHWKSYSRGNYKDCQEISIDSHDTLYPVFVKQEVVEPSPTEPNIKTWDQCTKSSNWNGPNAQERIMNILSPRMNAATFEKRLAFAKGRGVNCFNLFVSNNKDGEYAGYSIYGNSASGQINQGYVNIMLGRIKQLVALGYGVVLWLMADDDCGWNKTFISNWDKYCKDLKDLGFFRYASTVVIGLELNEYASAENVNNCASILRKHYAGKIGVHQTSNKYDFAKYGDIMFFQTDPSDKKAINRVKDCVQKCGKFVNAFEMWRSPYRDLCKSALNAGAFAVGNW